MDWYQEISVTNGVMYAGSRWIGSFSSHEAALEIMSIRREQRTVYSARETYCCTEMDLELASAIDYDER
ncbi:hypothetical protein LL999_23120 [Burkholderia ambifaria]|uniref:hypothetical protein n=1 Tax=Burkholderia ambifaria TaxID=152480 RepID=UPI001E32CD68|nr:hypothetical protein [Burkholderia ambifaria]UEP23138.1 hypothetical protein LL999_23120 [Burkholderia ambifaria]